MTKTPQTPRDVVYDSSRRKFLQTGATVALGAAVGVPLEATTPGRAAAVRSDAPGQAAEGSRRPGWERRYDAVVVGASLSGLITAALLARKGLKVIVVERTDTVGGHFGSLKVGDYWLDYGHRDAADVMDNFFIFNSKAQYYQQAARTLGVDVPLYRFDGAPVLIHLRGPDGRFEKLIPWSPDPEGSIRLGVEKYGLTPEQVGRLRATLAAMMREDQEKWIPVTFDQWLPKAFSQPDDKRIHDLLYESAEILLVFPREKTSVGRYIRAMQDPVVSARGHDPHFGSLQGCIEPFAASFRESGGEIALGLETDEILVEDGKVTGIVARDRSSSVQRLHAPVIVFAESSWTVFKALDQGHFTQDFIERTKGAQKGLQGDNVMCYLGLSRLPTIRSTGQPDTHAAWQQYQTINGFMIASLGSPSVAPAGKHMLWTQWVTGGPGLSSQGPFRNFAEAKANVDKIRDYLRSYYSDIDEITEWENYQWTRVASSAAFFWPVLRSPMEANGLDGLYFVGSSVESPGMYADIDAETALRASELIAKRALVSKSA